MEIYIFSELSDDHMYEGCCDARMGRAGRVLHQQYRCAGHEQIPYSAYPFLREYDAGCTAFTFLDAEGSELLTVTVSD